MSKTTKFLIETLEDGLAKIGLSVLNLNNRQEKISEDQKQNMIAYIEQLHRWNGVHNLTAVREPSTMIYRHILDSLTLLPYLKDEEQNLRILDVGTGAGLPGIPLSICLPNLTFILLDSNLKKIHFLMVI